MWRLYVFSVLAGLFAANGVPHFIKGGMGKNIKRLSVKILLLWSTYAGVGLI